MTLDTLRDEAREFLDDAIELRRTLHEWPEVGNTLPVTRETVLSALEGLPLGVTLHETTSGIAALLDGGRPGPTVLLRGDMDALALPEATGLEFSSKVDGRMHACGHDTHTSMLVGAARMLSDRRETLQGRVLFMFQPGEEGHHGARFMLNEGLLDLPPAPDGSESPVTGAFALHIMTALPTGMVATKGGPMMASSDVLRITVTGRGGHASQPHAALDPIPIACEIVQALQVMVTRSVDVFDPSVVTIGKIVAGTTNNVIPESAYIEGTIRAVSEGTRKRVHGGVRRVADGIAAAHGASADVEVIEGFPVTSNDYDFAGFTTAVAKDVVGDRKVVTLKNPVMGSEDFSYVLNEVPGTMMFLGGTPPERDPDSAAPNHSNKVMFDEDAMVTGIALYTAVAMSHLNGRPDGGRVTRLDDRRSAGA